MVGMVRWWWPTRSFAAVAAVLLLLAAAVPPAAAYTCYVDYDSERDATVVVSSATWAGFTFDVAVRVDLCREQEAQRIRPLYVVLNDAEANASTTVSTATATSSDGALRWQASLGWSAAEGDDESEPSHVTISSVMEWRDGLRHPTSPSIARVELCPDVKIGLQRSCQTDPRQTAMITGIVLVTLIAAAIVLAVASVRKFTMTTSNRRFERTTKAYVDGATAVAVVPERVVLDVGELLQGFPPAYGTRRPPTAYRGSVDAASGLQRHMHVVINSVNNEPFAALMSHGGVDERVLRFCVIQLLVVNQPVPSVPAGSVFLWLRKGRVGSAGRATLVRYPEESIAVYEFIGLLSQHLAEGWHLRRGTADHRAAPSVLRRERRPGAAVTPPPPPEAAEAAPSSSSLIAMGATARPPPPAPSMPAASEEVVPSHAASAEQTEGAAAADGAATKSAGIPEPSATRIFAGSHQEIDSESSLARSSVVAAASPIIPESQRKGADGGAEQPQQSQQPEPVNDAAATTEQAAAPALPSEQVAAPGANEAGHAAEEDGDAAAAAEDEASTTRFAGGSTTEDGAAEAAAPLSGSYESPARPESQSFEEPLTPLGESLRPFIGMSLLEHVHAEGLHQLTVDALYDGGPAAVAGLRLGDVVTHVNHAPVQSLGAVRATLLTSGIVGTAIDVTFVSAETGEAHEVALTVLTTDPRARGGPYYFDTTAHGRESSPRRLPPVSPS